LSAEVSCVSADSRHWRSLLRRTVLLLAIWFFVGPFAGILIVDRLNAFTFAGLPFGFWVAQQGAILVFVVLIFVNAWLAGKGDDAAIDQATGGER
jgi:putative solute:sodium symporter small subunit